MPLVFTHRYLKGYEFDHNKVAKAFDCKPYSDEAYGYLHLIHKIYRLSYIAAATGHLPNDCSKRKIILVLASGDDYDELKDRELEDVEPWFEDATKTALTGPNVYIRDDD